MLFLLIYEKTLLVLMKTEELNIKSQTNYNLFHNQLGLGLGPQSCFYFQGFRASKLLDGLSK